MILSKLPVTRTSRLVGRSLYRSQGNTGGQYPYPPQQHQQNQPQQNQQQQQQQQQYPPQQNQPQQQPQQQQQYPPTPQYQQQQPQQQQQYPPQQQQQQYPPNPQYQQYQPPQQHYQPPQQQYTPPPQYPPQYPPYQNQQYTYPQYQQQYYYPYYQQQQQQHYQTPPSYTPYQQPHAFRPQAQPQQQPHQQQPQQQPYQPQQTQRPQHAQPQQPQQAQQTQQPQQPRQAQQQQQPTQQPQQAQQAQQPQQPQQYQSNQNQPQQQANRSVPQPKPPQRQQQQQQQQQQQPRQQQQQQPRQAPQQTTQTGAKPQSTDTPTIPSFAAKPPAPTPSGTDKPPVLAAKPFAAKPIASPASQQNLTSVLNLVKQISIKPNAPKFTSPAPAPIIRPSTTTSGSADNKNIQDIISVLKSASTAQNEKSKVIAAKREAAAAQRKADYEARQSVHRDRRAKMLAERKRVRDAKKPQISDNKLFSSLGDRRTEDDDGSAADRYDTDEYTSLMTNTITVVEELSEEFNMLGQISIPEDYVTYIPPPMRTASGLVEEVDTFDSWAKEYEARTGKKPERATRQELLELEMEFNTDAPYERQEHEEEIIKEGGPEFPKFQVLGNAILGPEDFPSSHQEIEDNHYFTELDFIEKRKEFYNLPEYQGASRVVPFAREQKYVDHVGDIISAVHTEAEIAKNEDPEDRVFTDVVKEVMGPLLTKPPEQPKDANQYPLSDVKIALRADGTIMESLMTTILNPVALNKFHDIRAAELQERYEDQLFTYELWKDMVDTISYGPKLWALSYLRQLLPKLRKQQSKRDGRFAKLGTQTQKRKKIEEKRVAEGLPARPNNKIISPRNPIQHYKILNPLIEPEIVVRIPDLSPERAQLWNTVVRGTLQNPSFTTSKKRAIIKRWAHSLQHMGAPMQGRTIRSQEEKDNDLRTKFEKQDKKIARMDARRVKRTARRMEEREYFDGLMESKPYVDYSYDDMDPSRSSKSLAPI